MSNGNHRPEALRDRLRAALAGTGIAAKLLLGPKTKKILYIVGTALFALSLVYVGAFALRNWPTTDQLGGLGPAALLAAAALYGTAHLSNSAAWILSIRQLGHPLPFRSGLQINLTAQIGKYLPGNVAHYLARAGLASSSGVRLGSSGIATLVEILATLLAAATVVTVSMLLDQAPIAAVHHALSFDRSLAVLVPCLAIPAAIAFLHYLKVPLRALLIAAACLLVSFTLIGLSFFAIVSAVADAPLSPIAAIGIFAVAWTAGYVVPGAPAGLGIREAILIAWLGSIVGSGAALTCVMLHRVLSACVDALAAAIGYGWLRLAGVVR